MSMFNEKNQQLYIEEMALTEVAERFGTPAYVYSRAAITQQWQAFDQAFGERQHLICYAVKANANLAVLNVLARLGSGFDIVSGGELERVLLAGGDPGKTVFSGVGKSRAEIERALQVGVRCFNVESAAELYRIEQVASALGMQAPISIRVNPDVDAQTHPYISTGLRDNKFGIDAQTSMELYQYAADSAHLDVQGMDCHIGSQLTSTGPMLDAVQRLLEMTQQLSQWGIRLQHLDFGGGLGICYRNEVPPQPQEWIADMLKAVGDLPYEIQIEPGRAIVGNAGVLLTRVEYLKQNMDKHFAVVDAAMNDLLRPVLYGAWQDIVPVQRRDLPIQSYDVVGPVCESSDFLGKQRDLAISAGDLLAVCSAGAYGFAMSSNYNSRPRAVEIMVDGAQAHVVRARETFADLIVGEQQLPE